MWCQCLRPPRLHRRQMLRQQRLTLRVSTRRRIWGARANGLSKPPGSTSCKASSKDGSSPFAAMRPTLKTPNRLVKGLTPSRRAPFASGVWLACHGHCTRPWLTRVGGFNDWPSPGYEKSASGPSRGVEGGEDADWGVLGVEPVSRSPLFRPPV